MTLDEDAAFAGFQISQLVMCAIFVCAIPLELAGFVEFLRQPRASHSRNQVALRLSLFASGLFFTLYVACITTVAFSTNVELGFCNTLVKFCGYGRSSHVHQH